MGQSILEVFDEIQTVIGGGAISITRKVNIVKQRTKLRLKKGKHKHGSVKKGGAIDVQVLIVVPAFHWLDLVV